MKRLTPYGRVQFLWWKVNVGAKSEQVLRHCFHLAQWRQCSVWWMCVAKNWPPAWRRSLLTVSFTKEKILPSPHTYFCDCAVLQLLTGLCAHKFQNFTTWTDLLQEQSASTNTNTATSELFVMCPQSILTLILPRSRTGTVWFYTSTSNKRAARPKLYTKSLTKDLKLMYSRLTLVRISIKL